jgi:1-acyl-sn-glycerol-3-phosphate acyltransferase
MSDLQLRRRLSRGTSAALTALLELGAGAARDVAAITDGLSHGDDLDEWDPEHIRRTLPLERAVFGTYFRAEVRGLDRIPAQGPVLLVGNHSGGLLIADTFVFTMEFYAHFGPERRFHQLAHNLAARSPLMGSLRRYGTVAASHDNARAAFRKGAAVLVYPGGDYETFRPSWQGDELQFAGRHGFARLAISEGVPIVPVVAIGGQETALFVTRGERLARMLQLHRLARLKVLPISLGPPLGVNVLDLPGRLPLPAKVTVEVLPPIDLGERFGPEADARDVYQEVTHQMQRTLDGLSEERAAPVIG